MAPLESNCRLIAILAGVLCALLGAPALSAPAYLEDAFRDAADLHEVTYAVMREGLIAHAGEIRPFLEAQRDGTDWRHRRLARVLLAHLELPAHARRLRSAVETGEGLDLDGPHPRFHGEPLSRSDGSIVVDFLWELGPRGRWTSLHPRPEESSPAALQAARELDALRERCIPLAGRLGTAETARILLYLGEIRAPGDGWRDDDLVVAALLSIGKAASPVLEEVILEGLENTRGPAKRLRGRRFWRLRSGDVDLDGAAWGVGPASRAFVQLDLRRATGFLREKLTLARHGLHRGAFLSSLAEAGDPTAISLLISEIARVATCESVQPRGWRIPRYADLRRALLRFGADALPELRSRISRAAWLSSRIALSGIVFEIEAPGETPRLDFRTDWDVHRPLSVPHDAPVALLLERFAVFGDIGDLTGSVREKDPETAFALVAERLREGRHFGFSWESPEWFLMSLDPDRARRVLPNGANRSIEAITHRRLGAAVPDAIRQAVGVASGLDGASRHHLKAAIVARGASALPVLDRLASASREPRGCLAEALALEIRWPDLAATVERELTNAGPESWRYRPEEWDRVRRLCRGIAGRLGPEAIPLLEEELRSGKWTPAFVLAAIGQSRSVPVLIDAFLREDLPEGPICEVLWGFGAAGRADWIVDDVVRRLEDLPVAEEGASRATERVLGVARAFEDDRILEAVLGMPRRSVHRWPGAYFDVLGRHDDPRAIEVLLDGAQKGSTRFVSAAHQASGGHIMYAAFDALTAYVERFGAKRVLKALAPGADDDRRRSALDWFGRLAHDGRSPAIERFVRDGGLRRLVECMADDEEEIRKLAVEALVELQRCWPADEEESLATWIAGRDAVPVALAGVLRGGGEDRVTARLVEACRQAHPGSCGPKDLMARLETDAVARILDEVDFMDSLALVGAPGLARLSRRFRESPDLGHRARAAGLLAEHGSAPEFKALVGLLEQVLDHPAGKSVWAIRAYARDVADALMIADPARGRTLLVDVVLRRADVRQAIALRVEAHDRRR
jgi:hypothetical protein